MGCLVERYLSDLRQSIPEVDIYFPIRDYDHIDKLFQKFFLLVNPIKWIIKIEYFLPFPIVLI